MTIPTKTDLEARLASLRREHPIATAGGAERIARSIRLIETALLELRAHDAEAARIKQEGDSERCKEEARQIIRSATAHGRNVAEQFTALLASVAAYRAASLDAVTAWPRLKNSSGDTLLNDRKLAEALALEWSRTGLRLPSGGFGAVNSKSLAEKVRRTEIALLGALDGKAALYEVAAEMEPAR